MKRVTVLKTLCCYDKAPQFLMEEIVSFALRFQRERV